MAAESPSSPVVCRVDTALPGELTRPPEALVLRPVAAAVLAFLTDMLDWNN